jgi:hypothetical protein
MFDDHGQAVGQGDNTLAGNDLGTQPCRGIGGPDVVYTFELVAPAHVTAETQAQFDTVLAMRRDPCDSVDGNVACDDDGGEGTLSLISQDGVPAGVYYIIMDGYSDFSVGPFTLNVAVDPPAAVRR